MLTKNETPAGSYRRARSLELRKAPLTRAPAPTRKDDSPTPLK
jgi:hypothetical protein